MRELLYNFLMLAGQGFSYDSLAKGGTGLGRLMWRSLPSRREVATTAVIKHLKVPMAEAERIAEESFIQNFRSFMEVMYTRRFDPRFVSERVEIMNPELVKRFCTENVPGVAATAHLGAWELMVALMQILARERPACSVVVRRSSDEALSNVMLRQRTRPGVDIIEHRKAVFPVLRGLKKGGISAFLVDHNCTRSEAVFLPFLDDVAAVNVGPALLAVRSEAAIWPSFLIRQGDRYEFHVEEPLYTAGLEGNRQDRMVAAARYYTQAVEKYVRLYPEQWFWMHKRWKTRPEPGDPVY